jgi:hypothetical protein
MPVTADATALLALGKIGRVHILAGLRTNIFITPWVRDRELRSISAQVEVAVAEHWLRVAVPSATVVNDLMRLYDLDQGEAESIVAAGELDQPNMQLLLDEGPAFEWVQRNPRRPPRFHAVCLAQLLHQLEDAGGIESAATLMQELLDNDSYHWASSVWRHYEDWCQRRSLRPLPRYPRS